MDEFEKWMQEVVYYMMMAKLNESDGIVHKSGKTLLRVMRANDIHFQSMHEHGIESYDVPDEIREESTMYLTPR